MKLLYLAHDNGVTLDMPQFPKASFTLTHGVNDVPDWFANPWWNYHSDPKHTFPLIAEGVIQKHVDPPKPKPAEKPADKKDA